MLRIFSREFAFVGAHALLLEVGLMAAKGEAPLPIEPLSRPGAVSWHFSMPCLNNVLACFASRLQGGCHQSTLVLTLQPLGIRHARTCATGWRAAMHRIWLGQSLLCKLIAPSIPLSSNGTMIELHILAYPGCCTVSSSLVTSLCYCICCQVGFNY
jgi:hypothetical protein